MTRWIASLVVGVGLTALILPRLADAACTTTTASLVFATVQTAVTNAALDDTVCLPAGSATWSSTLAITKGITIQGAGVGQTVLTNTTTPFTYTPTTPSLNSVFRMTGVEFHLSGGSTRPFVITNTSSSDFLTRIRLDNNKWTGWGSATTQQAQFQGPVYGVTDNNTFDGDGTITPYHSNEYAWSNYTYDYGTSDVMVLEDNTFNRLDSDWYVIESGLGGRWVFRFNTIALVRSAQPLFDNHGNGGACCNASNMGFENYKNTITSFSGQGGGFQGHRGGKGVVWGMRSSTSQFQIFMREEFADSSGPGNATGPTGQPQHVSDSYFWDNLLSDSSPFSYAEAEDCCSAIAANVDYWFPTLSFTGATGVGTGTLASRPATCTTGVGYFATDQGSWNALGDDGLFYKCTSTNTWTLYYTPLNYPHSLRGAADIGVPGLRFDGGLRFQGGVRFE